MSFPITLNERPVTTARVMFPAFGVGCFEINLPDGLPIPATPGGLKLVYEGVTIVGSLIRSYEVGGATTGYCVFGYGGWREGLLAKAYQSSAGVKLETVLTDLERETGEKFDAKPAGRLGTHWARQKGTASRSLAATGNAWRVLPSGLTTVAPLPATTVQGGFEITEADEATGVYVVAPDDVAKFVPGVSISNAIVTTPVRIGAVQHDLGESRGRVTCYAVRA